VGSILRRNGLRRFERTGLEDKDAADHGRRVVEGSGSPKNAVCGHLANVCHVRGLDALTVSFREWFARRIGAKENDVVGSRLLQGSGPWREKSERYPASEQSLALHVHC
jgi:hypothetical protein